jgi:hypothetical protein
MEQMSNEQVVKNHSHLATIAVRTLLRNNLTAAATIITRYLTLSEHPREDL